MLLIRPKFVALDSSHLGKVAEDKASKDSARLQRAATFEKSFEESGGVLLLCWHHFQELLSHGNEDVAAQRAAYLQSLPLVAAIASFQKEDLVGSVLDLQAFEVAAAFENVSADPEMVRNEAAKRMFRLTSGADLVRPFLENWSALRAGFSASEERSQEVVAISKSDFAGMSDVKIVDLIKGELLPKDAMLQRLWGLHGRLAADIKERGDDRIVDPELTSREFFEDVVSRYGAISTDNPALRILEMFGVGMSEIGPNTTVADVGDLATFRKKLVLLNYRLGLPLPEVVAKVKEERLPSGIIFNAIRTLHPDTRKWDGSELTDWHMSCLAAYADVTYVDKRTHEAFRIARQKSKTFASLARDVKKAGSYSDIAAQLSAPPSEIGAA
ncbi:hypothetical protein NL532_10120 [Mesorhizobium sp. C120A]|uniref:hypothetical protein n=1 Tax=unclassified Mesorhizobium TaxID=325217 RepID=UPI0003D021E7|nr:MULTISPECIES: hypothetical protein [unclassified Mesorhizobium]ESZ66643.1 hypothetical protein X728_04100 [Mesorhizobium sp. L103C120A0]WJI46950.1 hypothetical protein NL532_10120 [Mesorhizobium sp. C120A]